MHLWRMGTFLHYAEYESSALGRIARPEAFITRAKSERANQMKLKTVRAYVKKSNSDEYIVNPKLSRMEAAGYVKIAAVPTGDSAISPEQIDSWITTQRRLYHAARLSASRTTKLESLKGWTW